MLFPGRRRQNGRTISPPRSSIVAPAELHRPTAAMVARCGLEKARAGEFTDPFTLNPLYIRRSAAEEKLDALTAAGPKA